MFFGYKTCSKVVVETKDLEKMGLKSFKDFNDRMKEYGTDLLAVADLICNGEMIPLFKSIFMTNEELILTKKRTNDLKLLLSLFSKGI